jgi:hypothetical protein
VGQRRTAKCRLQKGGRTQDSSHASSQTRRDAAASPLLRPSELYEKGLGQNHHSFRKLLERSGDVSPAGLYHTVHFLLKNNLAVQIYPINPPASYNLFALRCLPPRSSIDKFNQRIFPGRNFLEVIAPYSGYKLAREEEETLKYLLLKEVVGEVSIYIYRKCAEGEAEGADPMLE